MRKYILSKFELGILNITSFVIAIIVLCKGGTNGYEWLAILPFTYSLLTVVLGRKIQKSSSNLGVMAIVFLSFARYCLHPLALSLGSFQTIMRNPSTYSNEAILLMLYEMIAVYSVIALFRNENRNKLRRATKELTTKKLGYIIAFLSLYCVLIALLYPSISQSFMSISRLTDLEFTHGRSLSSGLERGSIERILITLFGIAFGYVRILIPALFLYSLKKKGVQESKIVVVAMLLIMVEFLFNTSTFADSILDALIILIILMKLCERNRRKIMILTILSGMGIAIVYFMVRQSVVGSIGMYSSSNTSETISKTVNAYFTGVGNVAGMMNVSDADKWQHFIADIQGAIPFNSMLFGEVGQKLSYAFNTANGTYGQIFPTIGAGYYYFSAILSPVLSVLLAIITLRMGRKAQSTDYYWTYVAYSYGALSCSLGIAMYNSTIVFGDILENVIPLIILASFSREHIIAR